jgi:hypothetical protein
MPTRHGCDDQVCEKSGDTVVGWQGRPDAKDLFQVEHLNQFLPVGAQLCLSVPQNTIGTLEAAGRWLWTSESYH